MASENQRAFLRKKVSFTFQVTSAERDGAQLAGVQGGVFNGLEISAGGMGFESKFALRRGDQLSVRLTLPGEKQLLRLTMEVVDVGLLTEGARKGWVRVGARFDRMEPSEQSYLNNYIGGTLLLY